MPATSAASGRFFRTFARSYADGRPGSGWALAVTDIGAVLQHGDGPDESDVNGAREAIVSAVNGQFVMYYDGCGAAGWRACQAISTDLIHWQKTGVALELGGAGEIDAACACSPWMIEAGGIWHMFYLATPNRTAAPDLIPALPYTTRTAWSSSPFGPWIKQSGVVPFDVVAGTYHSLTASPGHIIRHNGEYLQYFSAAMPGAVTNSILRTISLARTNDLGSTWNVAAQPLLPATEQIGLLRRQRDR